MSAITLNNLAMNRDIGRARNMYKSLGKPLKVAICGQWM
jgi:hypothetical protein